MIKLLFNTLTLALTLFLNYWLNNGIIGGKTIGDISDKYDTLFAPADYAFAIWGLIYLGLIAFVGFQWYRWKKGDLTLVDQTGPWFALSNIFNAFWLFAWLGEQMGLSVVLMVALLFSLLMLVRRLKMETWAAPAKVILFIWWPIACYLGWIIIATVANVAAWLTSMGWTGDPLSRETWTILLIADATLVYALLIYKRNLREAAFIGIWGLSAIAVRHWETIPSIAWTAIAACIFLFAYASLHGYRNRKALPFFRQR